MQLLHGREEFLAARAGIPIDARVGVVLTMGALHAGHAALIDAARAASDVVIATVFVNPLQFGEAHDLQRYPRTLDADAKLARQHGVDLLWAPEVADIYRDGQVQVSLDSGPLGALLEGASRPGHFNGMLTVVAKFLTLIRPTTAYFGEKDYQQLTLIRRMVRDLDFCAEIAAVPTVRELDGLALSSRNVFLSAQERQRALALSRALHAGQARADGGSAAVLAAADAELTDAGVTPDYLVVRSRQLAEPVAGEPARILVAARIGATRLIDNLDIECLGESGG